MKRDHNHRGAFTLIELLTVIAIIAVLAVLGSAVYKSAQAKAQQSQCASNLRQLYQGVITFAGDNDGRIPYEVNPVVPGDSSTKNPDLARWNRRIHPYLANDPAAVWPAPLKKVYLCPSDKAPYSGTLSYGFNDNVRDMRMAALTNSPVMLADATSYILFDFGNTPKVKMNHRNCALAIFWNGSVDVLKTVPNLKENPALWQPQQ